MRLRPDRAVSGCNDFKAIAAPCIRSLNNAGRQLDDGDGAPDFVGSPSVHALHLGTAPDGPAGGAPVLSGVLACVLPGPVLGP